MTDKIKEGLADMADIAERDHEVQMARAELYKIAKYSIALHDMLKGVSEAEGLEGWVQSKITKAADMIGSVYHHLDYDQVQDKLGEGAGKHCSSKCCGEDVKAEDCKCPPDCKGCSCNAVTEATEKASCGCGPSCSHCGGKHSMSEVGKKCECCGKMIKAEAAEGKSPHKKGTKKYKKQMAAMHAESANDPYKSSLRYKLAEKKSKGIEAMKEGTASRWKAQDAADASYSKEKRKPEPNPKIAALNKQLSARLKKEREASKKKK